MRVTTYEAIVENGRVRLPDEAHIPENTKVYVVVPAADVVALPRIASPRLVDPKQAADFEKQVEVEPEDAGL